MSTSAPKNVLLIGGSGFIGDYLVKKLVAAGGATVSVVHRDPLGEAVKDPSVSYHRFDLTQQDTPLKELISHSDYVVVLTRPDEAIIRNLIASASSSKRLKKIVYASSLLVYPDSAEPQDENTVPDPETAYEKDKISEEKKLSLFVRNAGCKLVITRLANIYGDVKNRGVIFYMMRSLFTGEAFALNGDGEQKRDFLFVEDAAGLLAYLVMAIQEQQIEIFNLCTGAGYTVNELIRSLEEISKKKANCVIKTSLPEKKTIVGDNRKILKASGYTIRYNLTEGLRLCYSKYASLFRE